MQMKVSNNILLNFCLFACIVFVVASFGFTFEIWHKIRTICVWKLLEFECCDSHRCRRRKTGQLLQTRFFVDPFADKFALRYMRFLWRFYQIVKLNSHNFGLWHGWAGLLRGLGFWGLVWIWLHKIYYKS